MSLLDPPSWITNPKVFAKVIIDGKYVPGEIEVDSEGLATANGKNKQIGASGEEPIIFGFESPEFTIRAKIHSKTQEKQMISFLNEVYYLKDPTKVNTLSIYHPLLAMQGINNCVIVKAKPDDKAFPRFLIYEIKCRGVSKPKPNAAKVVGTKTIPPKLNTKTIDAQGQQLQGAPSDETIKKMDDEIKRLEIELKKASS